MYKGMSLHNFIRDYKPDGWCCAIREVCFVPYISKDEYKEIEKGLIPKQFKQWYYIEAIKKYFLNQLIEEWKRNNISTPLAFIKGDI